MKDSAADMTIKTTPGQSRSSSFSDKLFGRISPSSTLYSTKSSTSDVGSNPYGIRLLYQPPSLDPVVDVIFVHGIKGHREDTWAQGPGGPPWPQTLLPLRIPNARVLTFGYDANPIAWRTPVSVNRIGDHSKNLVAAISRHRDNNSNPSRPIIFVAHSLGGLVCKDALLTSRSSADPRMRRISDSTRGIIFLGTPHTGASLATAAHRLARVLSLTTPKSNLRILRVLQKNSEVLARIQTDFYALLQFSPLSKPIQVSCFYEELKYPGLGDVIVSTDSAVLPGYTGIGIHAHHRDIARFATEDAPGFDSVVGELERWINAISAPSQVIQEAEHTSDTTGPPEGTHTNGNNNGYGGIEIWGDVIKSNVVNGNQVVHGNLTFSGS